MKKLITTMVALAFSLSAYSEIYLIERQESIGVWCVNTYVFVGHAGDWFNFIQGQTTNHNLAKYTRSIKSDKVLIKCFF